MSFPGDFYSLFPWPRRRLRNNSEARGDLILTIHLSTCVVENENLSSVVAYANSEFQHANFAS